MKKKIVLDMLLNIIATALPTFVLQLLILPVLSKYMESSAYGLLVTILALLNVIPATMGNSLNNIRLIDNETKYMQKQTADYNVILLIMTGLNIIMVALFSLLYDRQISFKSLFLTLVVSVLWLYRDYHLVAFRMNINYLYIVITNLLMVLGYLLGFLLFKVTGCWQYIYIFGLLAALLFIFSKSSLWREPLYISVRFRTISTQTVLLFFSNLLTRLTTYADKLLIFPLLGGTMVSIYYTATLFGKVVSMVITPVSSVMLSYLSKKRKKNNNTFWLSFFSSAILCIAGYLVCIAISRPVLGLLYPQFVDSAMHYIMITTGTMVLTALITIVNPFVLRFFDMKWQVAINGAYALFYVGISFPLLGKYGLYGFCVGTLSATIIKLIFMLIVFNRCKVRES